MWWLPARPEVEETPSGVPEGAVWGFPGSGLPRGVGVLEGPQVAAGGAGWWGGGLAVPLRGVHCSGWVQRSGHQPTGVGGKARPARAGQSASATGVLLV